MDLCGIRTARRSAKSDRAHLTTDADTVPIGIANPESLPSAASGPRNWIPRHESAPGNRKSATIKKPDFYLASDGHWYPRAGETGGGHAPDAARRLSLRVEDGAVGCRNAVARSVDDVWEPLRSDAPPLPPPVSPALQQAATELRDHLHNGINWVALDR